MEFFYSESFSGNQILLSEEESHHLFKVMRHRIGDELMVTDGKGKLVRAKLAGEQKKSCVLDLIEVVKKEPQPSPTIHIAIAPTKNIDRFEWFLEKATELGVTEITPVICQRSEREKIKPERLQKILAGAMKQSLRLWLPKLNAVTPVEFFFNPKSSSAKASEDKSEIRPVPIFSSGNSKFIAHCQSQNLPSFRSLYTPNANVLIMVGPEGDFTPEEIQLAGKSGFSAVNLGKNRLRTETAGIVAVHTVQLLNG